MPLLSSVIAAVLEQIEKERNGELIDKELLKTTVGIFTYLSDSSLSKEETSL